MSICFVYLYSHETTAPHKPLKASKEIALTRLQILPIMAAPLVSGVLKDIVIPPPKSFVIASEPRNGIAIIRINVFKNNR